MQPVTNPVPSAVPTVDAPPVNQQHVSRLKTGHIKARVVAKPLIAAAIAKVVEREHFPSSKAYGRGCAATASPFFPVNPPSRYCPLP